MNQENVTIPLLKWYQEEKRSLPWREDPTFYHVWLSEIMLQQTRVEAVKGYYERFLKVLPTIESLAIVPEEELLKLWEGLGYYNRARNLKKAAKKIIEEYDGKVPTTYETLLNLPGIGEYTAAAIASICYQEKVPAIDGNVLRVMMRLQNSNRDITLLKTKRELWNEMLPLLPLEVGDFNQALMDLGATVCLPNGIPLCTKCPLHTVCKSYLENTTDQIPVKSKKQARTKVKKTVFIFQCDDKFAITKRENKGLLAGMYEFPNIEGWLASKEAIAFTRKLELEPLKIKELSISKHIFTHIEWHMHGYFVKVEKQNQIFQWVDYSDLEKNFAIPTAYKVYKEACKDES